MDPPLWVNVEHRKVVTTYIIRRGKKGTDLFSGRVYGAYSDDDMESEAGRSFRDRREYIPVGFEIGWEFEYECLDRSARASRH
jgi:hypothetical protein